MKILIMLAMLLMTCMVSVGTPKVDYDVGFETLPGSQSLAIDSRAHHTLYHGTRGPGKTAAQLVRYARNVGRGYGSFWRGIIFDREYKNLGDLINQSRKIFKKLFGDEATFKSSPSECKWVWKSGEELLFRTAKKSEDYDNYHGHEYPFIGWNELTKQPTAELYDAMMSTNRTSFDPILDTPHRTLSNGQREYFTDDGKPLPDIFLECFSTTNPNGPGHNWVKRRFIDVAANGEVVRTKTTVYDPRSQQDVEVVKKQVAIFGSYKENKYLPAEYIAELNRLTANNENLRKAWLEGDWDFTAGGAFDDLWASNTHVITPFPIPSGWTVDRSFDWGSTHPFSVGWWAEANGEEVSMPDGSIFAPPAGSLIQIAEIYGTKEIGTNKGLRLGSKDIAKLITEYEDYMVQAGIVPRYPYAGPADNQINNRTDAATDTIADIMADNGVTWENSDKRPGSRINGLQLMRDRLKATVENDSAPHIYFFRNCAASIETIPSLPTDPKKPDDVDTDAEDHPWDMVRYRVLAASNRMATTIDVSYAM